MLLFGLLLGEIQRLCHIINAVRYQLLRELNHNLTICAMPEVLLINAPFSENLYEALQKTQASYNYLCIPSWFLSYNKLIYVRCP